LNQRNTSGTIPSVEKWIKYLKANGIKITDEKTRLDNWHFTTRAKYFWYQNDTIPLRKIRQDLGLRRHGFRLNRRQLCFFRVKDMAWCWPVAGELWKCP
jgi:hypothetical protein